MLIKKMLNLIYRLRSNDEVGIEPKKIIYHNIINRANKKFKISRY